MGLYQVVGESPGTCLELPELDELRDGEPLLEDDDGILLTRYNVYEIWQVRNIAAEAMQGCLKVPAAKDADLNND